MLCEEHCIQWQSSHYWIPLLLSVCIDHAYISQAANLRRVLVSLRNSVWNNISQRMQLICVMWLSRSRLCNAIQQIQADCVNIIFIINNKHGNITIRPSAYGCDNITYMRITGHYSVVQMQGLGCSTQNFLIWFSDLFLPLMNSFNNERWRRPVWISGVRYFITVCSP